MSQQQQENQNLARLQKLLGFDPDKRGSITQDVLSETIKEINEARVAEAKVRAKEMLTKALSLREQKVKLDKEYKKNSEKFDKELGKILKTIENSLSGKEETEEENKEEKKE
jgi:hypothetical protein